MPTTADPISRGMKAPDFVLPGVDGRQWSLAEVGGPGGTLVMFICNHCPYVKAIIERIVRDVRDLRSYGIGAVAISSNDASAYPDDSFPNMVGFAAAHRFPFPYLYDESQAVAGAYGAICTPDFFGFNRAGELQYRGRLDGSRMQPIDDAPRELFDAMVQIARTGVGPATQQPSVGCSIKWREKQGQPLLL